MFRFNRYVILFILISIIAVASLWKIVQSERFATLAVQEISKRFLDKENATLDIQRVELSIFPPATNLKNVDFKLKEGEEKMFEVKAQDVSVEFSFINLLSSDLVVDRVYLKNSKIKKVPQSDSTGNEKDKESLTQDMIRERFTGLVSLINNKLPFNLNSLKLENVELSDGANGLEFYLASFQLYENYLIGEAEVRKLSLPDVGQVNSNIKELDSFSFSLELADNYVNITDIRIKRMLDSAKSELNYRFDNGYLQGELNYEGGLGRPLALLREHGELDFSATGYTQTRLSVDGPYDDLGYTLKTKVFDFASNRLVADSINLEASYSNQKVTIEDAVLKNQGGTAELIESVVVYDDRFGLTEKKLSIAAQNLSAHTAFYPIRDIMKIVKGRLFGTVDVNWSAQDESVVFSIPENFVVEDFVLGEDVTRPILKNPKLSLTQTDVTVEIDGGVYINSKVSFGNSEFFVKGRVANNNIAFVTSDENIDLGELGPIAGVDISGSGDVNLKVYGPEDNVVFDVGIGTRASSVLGYSLGSLNANMTYSLNDNYLQIKSMSGQFNESSYSGDGFFLFGEGESGFELDLATEKFRFVDSKKVLLPLYREIPDVPGNLSFLASGEFNIKGDFENEEVRVEGPLSLGYIDFYGEVFDSLSTRVVYEKGRLALNDILLKKGEGQLKGSFLYNTRTSFMEYDAKWLNIRPHDFNFYRQFNLGLETNANLDVYGSGTLQDFTSRTKLTTKNSRVLGRSFEESEVTMFGQSNVYEIQGDLFDGGVSLTSSLDFSGKKQKSSNMDLEVDFDDIRDLLSIISSHNIQRDDLQGRVSGSLTSEFDTEQLNNIDLSINLQEFELRHKTLALNLEEELALEIVDGSVKESELEVLAGEYYIKPLLKGGLKEKFSFDVDYYIPMSVFELITPDVQISQGKVRGVFTLGGQADHVETYAETKIEGVVLQSPHFPGTFSNGELRATLDNKRLKVDSFSANYGKGAINGSGQIIFDFPFPTLSLTGNVSDVYIPFMNRSGVVTSGNFLLSGEELPYKLKGDVTILFAEILEDINEFQKQQAGASSYQRFLPQSEGRSRELIELDLDIGIQRAVQVRNSLLELNIDGEAQVTGPLSLPRPKGRFQVVPSTSKFKFKGHEFNLTKGTIELGEEFNRDGARLDFSGVTQINEYKVRLDVSGRTKNVEVALSSEPGLSQENLFSLLTLGVTSDVSTELDENERQSVATVGLGALLADQLRLNEGLDSSFGLRLSVLPEYAEESDTLLQGKSAVSDSGTNRFRSSTKVRVQKKISDKVDLSVSSTVGGSLEQRQEMNVNYKISNEWSLEGVYELKSTDDEGVESSDSIGADLKYRWSF